MKLTKTLIISFLLISFSFSTKAQIWKKLKEKVEQKVEQKIEQATDEIFDETLDGTLKKDTNEATIALPSKIEFTSSLEIEMTVDTDKVKMMLHFGKNPTLYGMTPVMEFEEGAPESYTVFSENTITLFMNAPGFKISKSIPQEQYANNNFSDKIPSKENIVKTGASKSVLGFLCYEYKYVNEKGSFTAWASKDFPTQKATIGMLGMRPESPIEGFILELTVTSDKETVSVNATDFIKNNLITIQTSEYKNL